jgi:RNA polymerase sigma-70 factor (ECF subfamily)
MTTPNPTPPRASDIEAARRRDEGAFERVVEPHRGELRAHCYRMLGSTADAEDALQETLLRAWRGLPRFEGRSTFLNWLYRIATNVCLRIIERRPKRVLPLDYGPPADPHRVPDGPVSEPVWLEPYADEVALDGPASPEARYEQRESVELGFVAALQHLPARQRAVLLLRDVLGFSPHEIAATLDATPAAVYSALQRAHRAVEDRLPARSQQATLRAIGDKRLRALAERYMAAWDRNDVDTLVALLAEDATFSMPPRPGWYRGREAVAGFLAASPMAPERRWRRVPVRANGQLAFGVYGAQLGSGVAYRAHALELLTLDARGRIAAITTFHLPHLFAGFGLAAALEK